MRAVLLSLLVGCAPTPRHALAFDDLPTATLRPEADPAVLDAWTLRVTADAGAWDDALTALGCRAPFAVGDGRHRVTLVPREGWTDPSSLGTEDSTSEDIDVRAGAADGTEVYGVLLHELGHAIGLMHADPAFGPSVMLPSAMGMLYPRDVAAAACVMGCGPCDPAADPYDD